MKAVAIVLIWATLAACGPTRYNEYRAQPQNLSFLERSVARHVGRDFYRPTPACAIVMPAAGVASPALRHATIMLSATVSLTSSRSCVWARCPGPPKWPDTGRPPIQDKQLSIASRFHYMLINTKNIYLH